LIAIKAPDATITRHESNKATKAKTKNRNINKTIMLQEKRKNYSKGSQETTPFYANF
jgi:hypothetical protein